MNQTVIVAIVTAAAALGGSGLTALVNLRSARLHGDQQIKLARADHVEKRNAELRQSRRDAYVRFLDQAVTAVHATDKTRGQQLTDEDFKRLHATARDEIGSLLPLLNVLSVEGPQRVLEQARELRSALYDELSMIRAVRRSEQERGLLQEAADRRRRAITKTTYAAREALGANNNAG
ncbi:hypothetical protein [Streptomyces sp. NPDC017964]|uniref:hypothetical protein n=1 Tax=Streptomyces sp. NPDC017964 TaxID=3365022 RepID=UPI00379DE08D